MSNIGYPNYENLVFSLIKLGMNKGPTIIDLNSDHAGIVYNAQNVDLEDVVNVLEQFNLKRENVDEESMNYYGETHVKGVETWEGESEKVNVEYMSLGDVKKSGRKVLAVYIQRKNTGT